MEGGASNKDLARARFKQQQHGRRVHGRGGGRRGTFGRKGEPGNSGSEEDDDEEDAPAHGRSLDLPPAYDDSDAEDPLAGPRLRSNGADLAALNAGAGPDYWYPYFNGEGITIGVLYSFTFADTLTAEFPREIAVIDYETVPAALIGDREKLRARRRAIVRRAEGDAVSNVLQAHLLDDRLQLEIPESDDPFSTSRGDDEWWPSTYFATNFIRHLTNFRRSVLGCIDSSNCESRRSFQFFSRSTRLVSSFSV